MPSLSDPDTVMPALANAVYDAVGVRIDEVPITPDKVVKALDSAARGDAARYGPQRFPEVVYPAVLRVPPPWEGGDGTASNDPERRRAAKTDERTATHR